eukprot:TRINITY_DN29305_c0_g2_i1.p1 TRINITY_DN29305_c0_g2~~TRINITY_DN29305_c0_g2_i1.p1  ORF type:complete len:645 (+),score=301.88 TRINITY_DN29305_c0_g2_i1:164-2098(+)
MAEPTGEMAKKPTPKRQGSAVKSKNDVRKAEKDIAKELRGKMAKYKRESGETRFKTEPDQPGRLKNNLKKAKRMRDSALREAARAEMVHYADEPGFIELDEGEEGRDVTQRDIVQGVDLQTTRKRFDITLDKLGPYLQAYSPNGNVLALAGEKGHLSFFHWKNFRLFGEVQLRDRVHDITFFHDDQLVAAAQRKYVYVYNNKGAEIHLLKNMQNIRVLDFLPQHMLLAGVGTQGVLHYFDVSVGDHVAVQKTKTGPCHVARRNPYNSVMALGHTLGTVSMWSPTCSAPLVKVLAHSAPLQDIAFPLDGRYMVTTAADSAVKVWDTRMWKSLHNIPQKSMPAALTISQTGLLAINSGNKVELWKDWFKGKPTTPYMAHRLPNNADVITRTRFCPYEDVLGLAHSSGFSSLIIPGSGEANYDYYVANPYETKQQRKERPVHQLLDKLPASMISLNPRDMGTINTRSMRDKKEKEALIVRQTEFRKKQAEGNGVRDEDVASDPEDHIIRPEMLPEDKKKAKIRRPKHLKEKRLFLQKQEHQRFLAKRAAQKKNRERADAEKEGREPMDVSGGGGSEAAPDRADGSVFDETSALKRKAEPAEEVLPNEPGQARKKRRAKPEPNRSRTALDYFFEKKEEVEHAKKNTRR